MSLWQTTANYPVLLDVTGTVPGAVRSLQDEEGDGQILLNWMVPNSDGGSVITDYLVRYRTHPSGSWSNIDTHSALAGATVTGLVNGTAYDVAVAAVNAIGTGAYSELDNLVPGTFPGAPTSLQSHVNFTGRSIDFAWAAPSSNGGSAIISYEVSIRDDDGTGNWSASVPLGASTFAYNFPGLTPGNHYDVRVSAQNSFGTGSYATASNILIVAQVYDITTCDELQAINNDLAGHYRLMNNIDCSATSTWNSGAGFIPIDDGALGDGFSGTLDGQGYAIENLYINSPNDGAGLFSALIGGAAISNLTLTGQVTGGANTAGLVGIASNGVTIDHVTVQMNVTATNVDGGFFVVSGTGGLAGLVGVDVVISHSSATGIVVDFSDGTKPEAIGGLVGVILDGTTVSDSYADVEAGTPNDGQFYIGGIAGMMIAYLGLDEMYVTNSYATGIVAGADGASIGGLVGAVGGGEIDNSFAQNALYDTSGAPQVGGVVGYSMGVILSNVYFDQSAAGVSTCDSSGSLSGCTPVNAGGTAGNYFKGNHTNPPLNQWDFDTVWQTKENDYPVLRAPVVTPPSDGGGAGSSEPASSPVVHIAQPTTGTDVSNDDLKTISVDTLQTIDLDQIAGYLNGSGTLQHLSIGQVLHFTVTRNGKAEQHSVTVISITGSSVTLEVASKPFEVALTVGESKIIEVEGQRVMRVSLQAVSDGQAQLSFSALPAHPSTISKQAASSQSQGSSLAVITTVTAGVFAAAVMIVILRQQHHSRLMRK